MRNDNKIYGNNAIPGKENACVDVYTYIIYISYANMLFMHIIIIINILGLLEYKSVVNLYI